MPMSDDGSPVQIIGAGPGGLATAAALKERGISAVVLEKSDSVGASWRGHYDRLRLHTTRALSALPGLPIPREYGRWVARDDLVRYLEAYTAHHGIEVATGVEVDTVERRDDRWVLHANGGRRLTAPAVVVATGYNHTAHLPPWPGRDSYPGELLHASRYRGPSPYADRNVLVVGAGNTGAEIAAELAAHGAGRVRLSVRTPPHIVRRTTLGWPAQRSAILCRRLPPGLTDRLATRLTRMSVPDLTAHGLPRPETGLFSRAREGSIPVQDVGLVGAVRRGRVEPVPAVESFDGPVVRLAGGGTARPDVVIAATGFRRGLEDLVGHLGVLDATGRPRAHGHRTHPSAPGLHFTGFTNPISGMLRELALDAPKIARAIARAAA
ncbi:NAD(P)/FAD-dependent oxidoreductase [Streptomyces albiaxialis]|uniref:NAD(P)/FAD-dependent oxidoreductase n=1 Tax=Streptomyces albiaxialis TaxID=329523 RepID=A0ABN2VG30_9ACTN